MKDIKLYDRESIEYDEFIDMPQTVTNEQLAEEAEVLLFNLSLRLEWMMDFKLLNSESTTSLFVQQEEIGVLKRYLRSNIKRLKNVMVD